MAACGLDFGTSNTALGTFMQGEPVLLPMEAGHATIPTAIFYDRAAAALIGHEAIQAYVEGRPGRLMRGLKSVLGTSLTDEATQVGRKRRRFDEIIADYLSEVKRRAEEAAGMEFSSVVHGRPVHFVDGSAEADRKAQDTLQKIARDVGFKDITFQFEPIAAALDYERQITGEEIALIADIGGGTSDFSIVRLSPERHRLADRQNDILANDGIRLGGTDFDRKLSLGFLMPLLGYGSSMKRAGLLAPAGYFYDLATWSSINRLYESRIRAEIRQVRQESASPQLFDRLLRVLEEQRGHTLAIDVENAKIALSNADQVEIPLAWVEPRLKASIGRKGLVTHTDDLAVRIAQRIEFCLQQAQLTPAEIDVLFLTGGTTRLPHLRQTVVRALPAARVIEGDTFGAVGKGLTIEAARRYGG